MYNAREVDATVAPQFHGMVAELAQRAGLPMPRVYLIDEDAPNPVAPGRDGPLPQMPQRVGWGAGGTPPAQRPGASDRQRGY